MKRQRTPASHVAVLVMVSLIVATVGITLAACGGSDPVASTSPFPSPSSTVPSLQDQEQTESDPTLSMTIPAADASFAEMKKMYAYDRGEPLDFEQGGGWDAGWYQHIEYASAGCTVTGIVAMPKGKGPFPVVLMAAPGIEAISYAPQASALNRRGVAVLAIDPPNVRDPNLDMDGIEQDPERYIKANARYLVDVRRALDLIETLPKLDGKRIGYVGWSWTGMLGALLAGVDPRVKAYVLDYAGGSNKGLEGLTGEVQDPAEYLAHNRGAAFLFQYTKEDTDDGIFSPRRVAKLVAAAPEPKTFMWVKGRHGALFDSADTPGSRRLLNWLEKNL